MFSLSDEDIKYIFIPKKNLIFKTGRRIITLTSSSILKIYLHPLK